MTPSAPASGAAQQPIALISILILAAAWILPGLVGHDPWKPDEAYTFGLIYSLLHGGDWVVPQLAQEPFMEKPPLFYLSAAAIASLLSPPFTLHDAARLTTGLYMALTFAFIAASARELYGANRGWVATLIFMGCLGIVIRSHQMITDISLLTGFALAFYGLALGLRRPVLGGFWLGTGVGWFVSGLSLWATLRGMGETSLSPIDDLPFLTMIVSISVVAGFISMIPGGLGSRDLIMLELLGLRLPASAAPTSASMR